MSFVEFVVYALIGYSVLISMVSLHLIKEKRYLRRTLLLLAGIKGSPMSETDQEEFAYLIDKFKIQTPEDILKITKEQLSKL